MRKLILFLLVFASAKVSAQVYQEMPQYGYRANRMAFDSTLQIPTVCGAPTLRSVVKANKNGAIAYDSCNAVFYTYNPKTQTWSVVSGGGGGSTDTTSLSNRINQRIDSLRRINDSVFARKNGVFVFQYKDSVGGSGGNFWKTSGTTILGGTDTISSSNGILVFGGGEEDMSKFSIQANDIDITTSGGANGLRFLGLNELTDTSGYKPLIIDNSGRIEKSSSWFGGSGGDFWNTSGTTQLSNNVNIQNDSRVIFSGNNNEMPRFQVNADSLIFYSTSGANYFYLSGLGSQTDTTTYKPLGIDNNGKLGALTSWVSGGGVAVDTIFRTLGKDSIFYQKNNITYAIKDSVGGTIIDTTSISNRINLKVPYTGANANVDLGTNKLFAQSIEIRGTNGLGHLHLRHQSSDATSTANSTVLFANSNGDLKYKNNNFYYSTLKTQQTADRVYTFQNKSYTLADSSDLSNKLTISDTTSMLSNYLRKIDTTALQPKSLSSYTIMANNTSATANATAQAFRDTSGAYSGSITWTGTTAPSGATNHSYRLTQVGKCVTLHIALVYANNGVALTAVQMALPSGAPTPVQPTGLTGASTNMYPVSVQLVNSANQAILSSGARGFLRNNTSANGFEIYVTFSSAVPGQLGVTLQYWTN